MANNRETGATSQRQSRVRASQLTLWIAVGAVGGVALGLIVGALGEAIPQKIGQTLCVGLAIAVAFGFILGTVRRRR